MSEYSYSPRAQNPLEASMAGLLQDIRFALRQLRKTPGFTITATAMLAVAICANGTVFSWIDGTMLHPIPGARDQGALVSVMRGQWNVSPAAAVLLPGLPRSAGPESQLRWNPRVSPRLADGDERSGAGAHLCGQRDGELFRRAGREAFVRALFPARRRNRPDGTSLMSC